MKKIKARLSPNILHSLQPQLVNVSLKVKMMLMTFERLPKSEQEDEKSN